MSSRTSTGPTAALAVAVVAISWGAILVEWSAVPPVVAAFYRVLFTALPLVPLVLLVYRSEFARMRPTDVGLAALAGLALAIHFAAWFESLAWTSIAASVTLVQSQPVFVALGARTLLGERISRRGWAGMLVAVVGIAAMSLGELLGGAMIGPRPLYGNGLALLGALMMAGYLLAGRSTRQRVAVIPYVVVVYGVCALALGSVVAFQGHPFVGYPAREWAIFIALAIVPGLLGHTLINWTLEHLRSSVVSVTILGEPIGAAILASVLFAELPTGYTVAGGAIALSGIYLTSIARTGHPRDPVEAGGEACR